MFEVGFSELCMVALVALLVIGPERLPKVARLAGFWLGKTRAMVANVKAEISAELQAEEMRQLFNEQSALQELKNIQDELNDASQTVKASLDSLQDDLKPHDNHEQT
ncbi:MAG: Sec-independent protein translocase protein TatB [Methylovulum sp.]|nr:Sec-independent protein translocase protein TatB [Methylovulum sp.]